LRESATWEELIQMYLNRKGLGILLISILSVLLLSTAVWVWGCGDDEPVEPVDGERDGDGEVIDGETVTLTLFFAYSADAQEWLVPEERKMSGVTDPCRAAMEELIKGPAQGSELFPVLPDTVEVLDVAVADGVCTVNVSMEILTDADQVGAGASGEMLALSAIANTLTSLDGVNRVKLLIEGMQSGMLEGRLVEDFWGHVGLPEFLERNEGIIYR
jgi:hypothetical protein